MQIDIPTLNQLSEQILALHGFSPLHQKSISQTLMTAQIDDCHSHGVWRLLHVIETLNNKKLSPTAEPMVTLDSGAVIKIDAQMGAAPAAFSLGLPLLVNKAHQLGIGLLAINHCVHFSALWVEIEQLTRHQLVGIAMTPSHAWVAPFGGRKPLLGTNPLAFGWPRVNIQEPYLFDFATTMASRGDIQLHERENKPLPEGWGINSAGEASTNPTEVLNGAMLPFGEHKGSAIATMIELLAGPLIGDMTSEQSMAFAENKFSMPYGGEIIIAINPALLSNHDSMQDAEHFFEQFNAQGARLPSQRRFKARQKNHASNSVEIPDALYQELKDLERKH